MPTNIFSVSLFLLSVFSPLRPLENSSRASYLPFQSPFFPIFLVLLSLPPRRLIAHFVSFLPFPPGSHPLLFHRRAVFPPPRSNFTHVPALRYVSSAPPPPPRLTRTPLWYPPCLVFPPRKRFVFFLVCAITLLSAFVFPNTPSSLSPCFPSWVRR